MNYRLEVYIFCFGSRESCRVGLPSCWFVVEIMRSLEVNDEQSYLKFCRFHGYNLTLVLDWFGGLLCRSLGFRGFVFAVASKLYQVCTQNVGKWALVKAKKTTLQMPYKCVPGHIDSHVRYMVEWTTWAWPCARHYCVVAWVCPCRLHRLG